MKDPALYWGYWTLAAIVGVAMAAALAALVSAASSGPQGAAGVGAESLLAFILVVWVLVPLTVPSLQDQLVEPDRLALFPLSAPQRMVGLAAGVMASPTALLSFLAASGPIAAWGMPWWGRLASPLVAFVFAATCIAVSRALQTFFAGTLGGRRGRDVSVLLAAVLTVGFYVAMQVVPAMLADAAMSQRGAPALDVLSDATGWLPGGASARVMLDLRVDDATGASLHMLVALAWLALFAGIWVWALSRHSRGTTAGGRAEARSRARVGLSLPPLALRWMRPSPEMAAASQHLRYMRRHPRVAQQVLIGIGVGVFVANPLCSPGWLGVGAMAYASYAMVLLGGGLFNFDGPGIGFLNVVGADLRALLRAKSAVVLWLAVLVAVVFLGVEAVVRGTVHEVPAAILYAVGGAMWTSAGATLTAARFAFDGEKASSQRFVAVGPAFATLGWVIAGTIVAALLYGLVDAWIPREVTGVLMVAVGALVYRVSLRAGARALHRDPGLVLDRIPARA
ncbi:hypothetical protein [Demequina capsici]|uniref:ABC-2 type transport system permease protein n=1 Tax=Demequina capsici TaxID=3075620 RepID=A0AA96JDN3_9MICO|nr:hypothetical protein [Demequina sp. OYTSA14]WNM24854.1 hypothetical protein RN606_01510 [Demequina sp. OYTSA14]